MYFNRICLYFLAFGLTLLLGRGFSDAGTSAGIRGNGTRFAKPVASLYEMRHSRIVRQGWDISCGAAALSTILTYHYNLNISERTIAVTLLKNLDPKRVRSRGGFSLLDLKRFVHLLGLEGNGYAKLTLKDLVDFETPAILPVSLRGYDHFVIFRGLVGGRVFIGDPSFGNVSRTVDQFMDMWSSRIGFFVTKKGFKPSGMASLDPKKIDMRIPDMRRVSRASRGLGPIPFTHRISPLLP